MFDQPGGRGADKGDVRKIISFYLYNDLYPYP